MVTTAMHSLLYHLNGVRRKRNAHGRWNGFINQEEADSFILPSGTPELVINGSCSVNVSIKSIK